MAKKKNEKKIDKKKDAKPLTEIEKRSYTHLLRDKAQYERLAMNIMGEINRNSALLLKERGLDVNEYAVDLELGLIVRRIQTPAEKAVSGNNKKKPT